MCTVDGLVQESIKTPPARLRKTHQAGGGGDGELDHIVALTVVLHLAPGRSSSALPMNPLLSLGPSTWTCLNTMSALAVCWNSARVRAAKYELKPGSSHTIDPLSIAIELRNGKAVEILLERKPWQLRQPFDSQHHQFLATSPCSRLSRVTALLPFFSLFFPPSDTLKRRGSMHSHLFRQWRNS
ncbi:hypothetical protein HDK90DRAFT_119783 [Phyllosticta capitalensis]|uniref:Uncharacterized protein n=1 Tax=Phyllosticta capitalensis TaxID=121624 RepID=A0ABR1Y8M0_9PEZI